MRVTSRLDDEEPALYVGRDGSVVESQGRFVERATAETGATEAPEAESA